ncbi:MAG: type II secretion system protein, partial [Gammaproteobacteria bacterium]
MKNISSHMTRPTQQEKSARQGGFTLLEVMVALTITGMALGSLFGIIAGNKRLAWRSEESLVKTMQARSLINFSQLN